MLEVKVVPIVCVCMEPPIKQIESCQLIFHVSLSREKNKTKQNKTRPNKQTNKKKNRACQKKKKKSEVPRNADMQEDVK